MHQSGRQPQPARDRKGGGGGAQGDPPQGGTGQAGEEGLGAEHYIAALNVLIEKWNGWQPALPVVEDPQLQRTLESAAAWGGVAAMQQAKGLALTLAGGSRRLRSSLRVACERLLAAYIKEQEAVGSISRAELLALPTEIQALVARHVVAASRGTMEKALAVAEALEKSYNG